jgi:hypothetical protein
MPANHSERNLLPLEFSLELRVQSATEPKLEAPKQNRDIAPRAATVTATTTTTTATATTATTATAVTAVTATATAVTAAASFPRLQLRIDANESVVVDAPPDVVRVVSGSASSTNRALRRMCLRIDLVPPRDLGNDCLRLLLHVEAVPHLHMGTCRLYKYITMIGGVIAVSAIQVHNNDCGSHCCVCYSKPTFVGTSCFSCRRSPHPDRNEWPTVSIRDDER